MRGSWDDLTLLGDVIQFVFIESLRLRELALTFLGGGQDRAIPLGIHPMTVVLKPDIARARSLSAGRVGFIAKVKHQTRSDLD